MAGNYPKFLCIIKDINNKGGISLKFLTSDAVTLAATSSGDGIPVIFLAGYSGTTYSWAAQNLFFSTAGFHCIHLDKRGHGENTDILSGLRISRLAKDIQELVYQLGLDQFHLVSHSLGSGIAFEYLSLFGEDQVKSLTIIDSPPKAINTSYWSLGMYDLTWQTVSETVENFSHVTLTKKKIETDLLRSMHQGHYRFNFLKTAPLVEDFLTKDYRDVLKQVSLPILYIGGEQSPLFSNAVASYYSQTAKQATSYLIKDAGHLPYAESPAEVNQLISQFILDNQ